MGYPSTGCESIYRNSLSEVLNFMGLYHKDVKIYNLCLEKNRIYSKDRFPKYSLAIFPFSDHNPCPIKLMLDFCVDIVLYLLKQPEGVVAIHCKAGKGRTGVMIICYLVFSGLCKDSNDAIYHYSKMRTKDCKGVTIASQIRYIKYFEAFLATNFTEPYYLMIPQIIRYYINPDTTNIIQNYLTDDSYFKTKNNFVLNYIRIGPFTSARMLKIQLSSLVQKDLEFPNRELQIQKESEDRYYFLCKFHSSESINFDICIKVQDVGLKFYCWVNLWYSCLELISHYILHKKLFLKNESTHLFDYDISNINKGKGNKPDFKQMQNIFYDVSSNTKEDETEDDSYNNTIREIVIKNQIESFHYKNSSCPFSLPKASKPGHRRRVKSSDRCLSVLQLIDDLSNDPDLNTLISGLNAKAMERNTGVFDKDSMSISLHSQDLDKFVKAKEMPSDFCLVLNFSLKV